MALPFLTSAQTPPELDLQLYVGLSITGSVGTVYSVELLGGVRHGPRPDERQHLALSDVPPTIGDCMTCREELRG